MRRRELVGLLSDATEWLLAKGRKAADVSQTSQGLFREACRAWYPPNTRFHACPDTAPGVPMGHAALAKRRVGEGDQTIARD